MFVCLSANCRTLSYSAFCGSLITRSGQASVSSAVVTYHGLMVSIPESQCWFSWKIDSKSKWVPLILPFNLYSLMLRPVSWTNLPFWSKWLDNVGFLEFIVLLSSLCRRDFDHRLLSWVGSAEVPTAQHRPSAPPHPPPKSLCSSAMGEPLDTSCMAGASVGNECKRNSSGSSTASTTRHYIIGIVGRKAYQPGKAAPDLKRRKKKQQEKKRTKKEEEKKQRERRRRKGTKYGTR